MTLTPTRPTASITIRHRRQVRRDRPHRTAMVFHRTRNHRHRMVMDITTMRIIITIIITNHCSFFFFFLCGVRTSAWSLSEFRLKEEHETCYKNKYLLLYCYSLLKYIYCISFFTFFPLFVVGIC
ncbi:hypothetical protein STCU_11211 [Strigomonas culicis]|uniref:Uncharacterized protein n=1 Tax=Strigomonas culicis TaxID=28005 RepID=S9V105_9TRYP|nr:hypothetical protein STCU_11211 [Strigomonas culicis]|eukprot:EPY16485.1 hypothetical protein STCU_11211 [Strigomonas culicis]